MNTQETTLIVFGGKSAEHEVSLNSARNIYDALDKTKYKPVLCGISQTGSWYSISPEQLATAVNIKDSEMNSQNPLVTLICEKGSGYLLDTASGKKTKIDVAFPVMHGTYGEDGSIQGLFRMMNLPFVGCGILGSAMGMDKEVMKRILTFAKIPNAKYILLTPYQKISYEKLVTELGSPFFIKPANMGSSVGVHKIKNLEDFNTHLADAFKYDEKVLAEEFIQAREIECSVLGMNHAPEASVPGEIIPHHEFYSYEAKYIDANGAGLRIPADLNPELAEKVRSLAMQTYQALCCEGMTRVDFFLKANNELLINEVNTIPGFTKVSMYPKMWGASGLNYSSLITKLLALAKERHKMISAWSTNFK